YTGVRGQTTLPCLATAADHDLIRWSRSDANPVIASWPPEPGVLAFRDHTAWRAGATWYQVIGGGLAGSGGALFLYRSQDLRRWQYAGVFLSAADHGLPGQIWECPDVFTLDGTAVVIVSVIDADGPAGAIWITGEITGDRFAPRSTGRCDGGDRYYAPQSLALADGRRIGIGWLRESLDELTGRDRSRVGVMSLPRELYLEDQMLRCRPARELGGARGEQLPIQAFAGNGMLPVKLAARAQSAAEILLTPARAEAGAIVLRLRGIDCDDVEIQVGHGFIAVHEGERPLTTHLPVSAPAASPVPAGPVSVYYDAGILEVYAPNATPTAVICNRDGRYDGVAADLRPAPGARPGAASITGWSSG
ncbi:MAG TPA: glycoside hydrolase family 32 protein, partial [Streptosporangiaceae bacterium]|nr:glycoside hydrolase family 32 protein [Streptosporangiaceae bacterium]